MSISTWWSKFKEGRLVKKAVQLLHEFDLDEKQVGTVIDTVISVDKAAVDVPGLKKADRVVDILIGNNDVFGLSDKAIQYITTIVKLAWLVAKVSGRLAAKQ